MKIALIACSASKNKGVMPAWKLYDKSQLFKLSYRYAKKRFDQVFIISAKYFLLDPKKVINDYNVSLNNMSFTERQDWAKTVFEQLKQHLLTDNIEIYFFAGNNYKEFLMDYLKNYKIVDVFAHKPIGKILQYLTLLNK